MSTTPASHGDSNAHTCHAVSAPAGYHRLTPTWVRNTVITIVGAVRAVVR